MLVFEVRPSRLIALIQLDQNPDHRYKHTLPVIKSQKWDSLNGPLLLFYASRGFLEAAIKFRSHIAHDFLY